MSRWIPPGTVQDALDQVLPHGNLTFPSFSNDRGTLKIREWMEQIWLHGFITGTHDLAEQLVEGNGRRLDEGKTSILEHEELLGVLDRLTARESTLSRSLRYNEAYPHRTQEASHS